MAGRSRTRLYVQGLDLVVGRLTRRDIRQILAIYQERFPALRRLKALHVSLGESMEDDRGVSVGGWQLYNRIGVATVSWHGGPATVDRLKIVICHELGHAAREPTITHYYRYVRSRDPEERQVTRESMAMFRKLQRIQAKELELEEFQKVGLA